MIIFLPDPALFSYQFHDDPEPRPFQYGLRKFWRFARPQPIAYMDSSVVEILESFNTGVVGLFGARTSEVSSKSSASCIDSTKRKEKRKATASEGFFNYDSIKSTLTEADLAFLKAEYSIPDSITHSIPEVGELLSSPHVRWL